MKEDNELDEDEQRMGDLWSMSYQEQDAAGRLVWVVIGAVLLIFAACIFLT